MLIGCIADDLTGATDLAVTLAREAAAQVKGVSEPAPAVPATDAVIAP